MDKTANIVEKKAALRREIRAVRRALDENDVKSSSEAVMKKLVKLDAFSNAKLILSYKTSKNEIDCTLADEAALAAGKRVAYPLCIENGGLRLFVPNTRGAFKVGSYGILEPDVENSTEVFADELDLIIVPAVAFDRRLARLGQGGGYYDRLLKNSSAFTVGVGYDFQLLDELPVEKHDSRLDIVLTPSDELICGGENDE